MQPEILILSWPMSRCRSRSAKAVAIPWAIGIERAVEGRDLADHAAGVRVALVQRVVGVECGEVGRVGMQVLHVLEPEMRREVALVGERLLEEHEGVDHQHRRRRIDPRDHVQEDGRLGAEGGDEGDLARELGEDASEDVLGPGAAVGQAQRVDPVEGGAVDEAGIKPHRTAPRPGRGRP
jgi:hypothetical protein